MASRPYHSDHWGFTCELWVLSLSYTFSTPVTLSPHRSFAHAIRDAEEILQPPSGGDDHDEPPASWYHQPCSIH